MVKSPAPNNPRRYLPVALSCLVLAAIIGVHAWATHRPGSVRGTATRAVTVKIGLLAPLTGDQRAVGETARQAIAAAQADAANTGASGSKADLAGINLQVVERDSGCDPDTAERAIQDLIAQTGVIAVIGDYCSPSTLAALPLATRSHVVLISPAATSTQLSGASPYFLRTALTDTQQGEAAAQALHQRGLASVAILHADDPSNVDRASALASYFTELGGAVVSSDSFAAGASDFRSQFARLSATRPAAVFVLGPVPAATLAQQARQAGLRAELYNSAALDGPNLIATQTALAFTALARAVAAGARTGDDLRARLLAPSAGSAAIQFTPAGDVASITATDLGLHAIAQP